MGCVFWKVLLAGFVGFGVGGEGFEGLGKRIGEVDQWFVEVLGAHLMLQPGKDLEKQNVLGVFRDLFWCLLPVWGDVFGMCLVFYMARCCLKTNKLDSR